jgi:transcriptional regulator with XRE-family HTH domain
MEMSRHIVTEGMMNERIKELRKALGLTLEKFGERLGVTKVAISRIENGINNVTDQMFILICREFKVNEEWLRDGVGEMFFVPDDETAAIVASLMEDTDDHAFYEMVLRIVSKYNRLSPTAREAIDELCDELLAGREVGGEHEDKI